MRAFLLAGTAAIAMAAATGARAGTTGATGDGFPFDNRQPYLPVTEFTPLSGIDPSSGSGSALGDTLGFVYDFGGNFVPGNSLAANGQLLPISPYAALFNVLGTTYGGNGVSNFALPDLRGAVTIGAGTGPGLSTRTLGQPTGSIEASLSTAQIPPHDHTLPGGGVTGVTGGGQPFSNMQVSLPLETLIATSGVYPATGGGSASAAFLGQIGTFAGTNVPAGWTLAAGQLLPIATNAALFSILGTTYGGDGITTFALPDLQGRTIVGVDATHPLGATFGSESTTLTVAQLPPHVHTLPGGGHTGVTGGGQPFDNDQPSVALNYLIAVSGTFPSTGGGLDPNVPFLGEIVPFAGNFAPSGWEFADGQTLSIASNLALFAILGDNFGGNGTTTFNLPDLRGRTPLGTGENGGLSYIIGEADGADQTHLTVANLPPHEHALPAPVPEPATLTLLGLGIGATFATRRARRRSGPCGGGGHEDR
jgi:microcystin-dependent protein